MISGRSPDFSSSVSILPEKKKGLFVMIVKRVLKSLSGRRKAIQAVGMIASANVIGMILGVVGSLFQK